MGRYIKPGPIGLTGGLNGYGYAYQNSVVSFDSKELLPFIVILIVWGIIETAMMAYDTYDTVQRLVDLCVSYFYKSITFAAFIAKLGLPGGGYSSGIRIKASQKLWQHYEPDLIVLQHEYFEPRFERIFKTDYKTAYKASEDSGRKWRP